MMPMADVFAPDINYVSSRSVFPTSPGGSIASAAGAMTAQSSAIVGTADGGAGVDVVGTGPISMRGHGLYWWLGFVALLLVMVFVARKAGGEEDFRNIRPTMYNFFAITLTSIVGIVGLKVVAAKWPIPGASDVILAA